MSCEQIIRSRRELAVLEERAGNHTWAKHWRDEARDMVRFLKRQKAMNT